MSAARKGGAVACGHPATAAAAAEMLDEGGNAFDAALAAFAAATVVEPVLASLGGGGFLLAETESGAPLLYDFFVETPRRRHPQDEIDFYPVVADFGTATQEFHIGLGALATPGAIAGLAAIHRDLASLPLPRLLEPAVRFAREGYRLRELEVFIHTVVAPIITATPEARALFARPDGTLLAAGDLLRQPELADSLEWIGREGDRPFYQGELGQRLMRLCRDGGGQLGEADLRDYRVVRRKPLTCGYRDARLVTNPPPSTGGILIAFALRLLDTLPAAATGSDAQLQLLARVMELTNRARIESGLAAATGEREDEAAAGRLLDPDLLRRYTAEVAGQPVASRGTTHISVIDRRGNAAALTLSNGEGCGRLLPGSGIMLNNMLGEEDLNPQGFQSWPPGSRLGSMMAPSLLHLADGSRAVLGSGGSNRIRTAILQVVCNLVDGGLTVSGAVDAPRLHVERGEANLEAGHAGCGDAIRSLPEIDRLHVWPNGNLFFGGVHAVRRGACGALEGGGDHRRGGVTAIV